MSNNNGVLKNPYERMRLRSEGPIIDNKKVDVDEDVSEEVASEEVTETEEASAGRDYKEGLTEEEKSEVDKVLDGVGVSLKSEVDSNFFGTATREQLINKYKNYVTKITEGTGIHPETFFAQLIVEAGINRYGDQNQVSAGIRKGFNPFNLKQYSNSGVSETYGHKDDDYDEQGNLKESPFIKYNSAEEGFKGYVDFILRNPRYAEALKAATPEEQIRLIANAGFAGGIKGEDANREYRNNLLTVLEKDINPVLKAVLRRRGGLIYKRK